MINVRQCIRPWWNNHVMGGMQGRLLKVNWTMVYPTSTECVNGRVRCLLTHGRPLAMADIDILLSGEIGRFFSNFSFVDAAQPLSLVANLAKFRLKKETLLSHGKEGPTSGYQPRSCGHPSIRSVVS